MAGLLPVAEALARILGGARKLDTEMVPLGEAGGRVLVEDLRAKRQQPPFAASAMDGYAVRVADVATIPATLKLIGQSAAGHAFSGVVSAGEAVRIFTGAPLPQGADSVVIQENTVRSGEQVAIVETITFGKNIRKAGLDFEEGDLLLDAGRVLDPAALALAAAANHPVVPLVRRPRVAILATGDELVSPGETLRPDQIVASNSYGLAEIVREAGGVPIDLGIAEDRLEALSDALDRAIDASADILVTLGGASVGDHDLVQPALAARGMELDFWKIALRPGKPLMFGRLDGMQILGLPGNPVSSLICSHIFLTPLIRAMLGLPHAPNLRTAILGSDMGTNDQRQDYVRARVTMAADGTLTATPFAVQDSSMLKFMADADGLIIRKPHAAASKAGSACDVLMLR
ncbi:molybdopterin molybdenumtransferase MoeA [Phyllobacterium brassicacearum]|uniref:Molybdopterin molybdenumtransferase n=1 Tax=Phyllobacterium brassicacearum TaxID=314235 RepID=A0A2P7BS99_9HYPH|nr:gephyrin-like molybdotransferase Glp [Phyllobacterium brassicacearum]PSH69346.1 molybdopterin molybdenumtransferase MoeA [Phyllobacterium brassicacearum]TDQ34485.1 molybdopterin molybdochelatase [Phyllobacterium brassicacearum]